jgi:hypothetical protein
MELTATFVFALALFAALPWGALIVLSWVFFRVVARCIRANEVLTEQVCAVKTSSSPWMWQQPAGGGSGAQASGAGYQPEAFEDLI